MELGLRPDDRVLVLGSSGWFGREFMALFRSSGATCPVLGIPGPSSGVEPAEADVRAFDPTVVLNFAFLTRERVEADGVAAFTETNRALTERFRVWASGSTVRLGVTVSSGAALTEPDHPYGALKAEEESLGLELVSGSRAMVVLRAYAVSGGYVRRPRDYAFSDFIVQAHAGSVHVRADRPVLRRYSAVSDALTVALRAGLAGRSGILDTGGELVEVGDLARRVIDVVNPAANLSRSVLTSDEPSSYHSDDSVWCEWISTSGVEPMNLEAQIRAAADILVPR
jgi:nucleoside-diphosphate-sugar epimerase